MGLKECPSGLILRRSGCAGLKEYPGRIAPALLRLCWAERTPLGLRPRCDHAASDCPEVSAPRLKKHLEGNDFHVFSDLKVKRAYKRQ